MFFVAARFNSPILQMLREEIRRRPPPPTYTEALDNSVFEEPIIEGAPEPPLIERPLTREQVLSVRSRSMKVRSRVDVATSCHLPAPPPPPGSAAREGDAAAAVTGDRRNGGRRTVFELFIRALRLRGMTSLENEATPTDSEVTNTHDSEMHPSPSTTVSRRHSSNSLTEHREYGSIICAQVLNDLVLIRSE